LKKIFATYTLDKGPIKRIYKELKKKKKLISPKINEPIRKWATTFFQSRKSKWPKHI
jgi:hypothetical protein